ncbi:Ribonuclease R [Anaerococcus prevotii]|uniref:Ribonuclease R n=1 Tax=Anaerococcus prevotii (strain ATCC 9321 / DSM 20548 / JCM 6508 / NCTC 11806 / PC1) TaxID=525919 RepID=C7RH37_ANAPD|nr:ribonuclease R [Anaerococcus prevotii]ACV28798.1 ribonuclease R [Anaerococcus prevotii DSM 20548]SUU94473.1 Ribonuclease R [Anaerococcus prevotii]
MNLKDIILNIVYDENYLPMTFKELDKYLKVDKYTRKAVRDIIKDLEKENKIRVSNKKRIMPLTDDEINLIGKISMAQAGYGFFISDNRDFEDVFIKRDNMNKAHNNDRVKIELIKRKEKGRKAEGRVIEIIERAKDEIVGSFQKNKGFGFVIPDDRSYGEDIFIAEKFFNKAKNKDKVVVEIINYPKDGKPEGRIKEIIGGKNDKNIEILSLIRAHGLPYQFSKETKKESLYVKDTVNEIELEGRKDLRDLFTVTIDGRDSKDFDDAISIEKNGENYDLYVHIADVAHYVKKGTAIDNDAYERGNSTYLFNIVIPMLPEVLSNGICSLNPNEDRLAISLKMTINDKGKVIDNEFYESVINSDHRLVYDDVNAFLDKNDENVYEDELIKEKLRIFDELREILNTMREKRGSIDFNFSESQIDVAEDGRVLNISNFERGSGNKMIEEFMLAANETVASLFAYMDFPFIYRIHEKPKEEKIESFKKALNTMGYNIRGNDLHPKDFQQILEEVEGKDVESVINILMLRTMQKAKYSEHRDMHFGLSTSFYTHFTSPIRRYPDLIVHRLVKKFIHNKLTSLNQTSLEKTITNNADHLSMTERRSEDCERDVEDLLKCKYMTRFIGDEFYGNISAITEFGIFIELDNTVEGLFMYKFSNDRYEYLEDKMKAFNTDKKIFYSIGDRVKIRVMDVDTYQRNIDFDLEVNDEIISQQ